MAGARYAPHKTADDVIHRADRMQVKLSQSDDGWALEGLPFTMTQLGYPNLEDSAGPGRVLSNSLNEANHYLFLCEQRILASSAPPTRIAVTHSRTTWSAVTATTAHS